MSTDDRLARLEQRVAVLERLVRQLVQAGAPAGTPPLDEAPPPPPPPPPPPSIRPSAPPPKPEPAGTAAAPGPAVDREQWLGQRALLAVGVVALVLAAGYLLKLAFDRGWISPVARCVGGVLAGGLVGGLGWRLERRGMRVYGASLIGAGAGVMYLAIWAAARLYGLVPPAQGIAALALVSLGVAAIAYAINVQALGSAAALGALFAPLLLGQEPARADLLLLYLGTLAVALGFVAARRQWRQTALLLALMYFLLPVPVGGDASPWPLLVYGVVGGSGGLLLGLRERWWETRFLSFGGGWGFVAVAATNLAPRWPVLAAALVLSAPVWWVGLRRTILQDDGGGPVWSLGEALYFLLTPIFLGWAVDHLGLEVFERHPGLPALAVAVGYLAVGYARPRPAWAFVGTSAAAIAALLQWPGLPAPTAILVLALLWAALDHRLDRFDGRWYALLALLLAVGHLFGPTADRSHLDRAFVGPWPLVLFGVIGVGIALAAGLWRGDPERERGQIGGLIPGLLWVGMGALLLFGVSGQLRLFFAQRSLGMETAALAGGLSVSAWWLVFASALVLWGFRTGRERLRWAGLGVAALAVVKVTVFDLATLDALYRVGSVFALAVASLALAYVYHRRAR